jgi:hypothetical protein
MRLAVWLLAAVAIALLGASPAGASWSRERVAAHIGIDGYGDLALAGNGRGDAALLFETRDGLSLALARPGHGFGRPRAVPHVGDETNAGVAMDERGNVLVVWTDNDHTIPAAPFSRDDDCCNRVRVALLRAESRRFSGPKTISPRRVDAFPQAFSIVNGRVGIAWNEGLDVVGRFSRRGLGLGPAVRTSADYALAAVPLRTGPVLTFYRYHYTSGGTVRWSLWDLKVRGRSPVVRKLFSRHGELPSVDLAANARGDQALTWSEQVASNRYQVFAAARSRNGPFHPRRVSPRGSFDEPHVAIGSTGAAVAGWGDGRQLFTAGRRPGGAFGKGVGFGRRRTGVFFDDVQVACATSGRAVIAWRQQNGQGGEHEHAAFRSRGGRRLNDRDFGPVSNFGSPDVTAMDDHAVARVAWANDAVYAARGRFPR